MVNRFEIEAKLRGAAVPRGFTGRVASVHKRVVNLEGEDQLFLSLVSEHGDMSDRAILVPRRFFAFDQQVGAKVEADVNRLRFVAGVSVLLHWAAPWSGDLRPRSARGNCVSENELHRRLSSLKASLRSSDPGYGAVGLLSDGGGGDPFTRAIGRRLRRRELASLIGLGIGFTPSGDDLLSGISLYLEILRILRPLQGGEVALATALRSVRPAGTPEGNAVSSVSKTTTGGATLLSLTLHGSFPAYQLRLATSLLEGDQFDSASAVTLLERHGESSGLDMATGLVWAAENCRK